MVVEGFNPENDMELVGIRRHNMDPMMEDDDYLEKFAELYPFAMVDFERPSTFIGDATNGEFVVAEPREKHAYTTPEECEYCTELE